MLLEIKGPGPPPPSAPPPRCLLELLVPGFGTPGSMDLGQTVSRDSHSAFEDHVQTAHPVK